MFATIDQVNQLVAAGKALILAGDERALRSVAPGNWIGGTIPYFMTEAGGVMSRDGVFIEEIPAAATSARIQTYDCETIASIGVDSPANGYTVLILPAFSALHRAYALDAPDYPELFLKVVAGWVAGAHLDDLATATPKTFDGRTGEVFADRGVALHVELPAELRAELGIVNIFEPGDGEEVVFPETGFEAGECLVDGVRRNFREYFVGKQLDSRLPLIADAFGTRINVSIRSFDAERGTVQFFAPVFDGIPYRVARPITSYPRQFAAAIPSSVENPAFACNCVLNYVYGQLEGNRTGSIVGPMTFGEIAYQLLNQTLVHVTVTPAL